MAHGSPNEIMVLDESVAIRDLQTVEQCEAARMEMVALARGAEAELALARSVRLTERKRAEPIWLARTGAKWRLAKMAIQEIERQRAIISKSLRRAAHETHQKNQANAQRAIISAVKEIDPDLFVRALKLAGERHPELFPEGSHDGQGADGCAEK